MQAIFYPLLASKLLNHCKFFLEMMRAMESEELVELGFNDFVANLDRVLEYLRRELSLIGGEAPKWLDNKIKNLPLEKLFVGLRDIVSHHYIIPLTPIFYVDNDNVKPDNLQLNEMRLDIQMLPKYKLFDEKRQKFNRAQFIKELGESVDAVKLSADYLDSLTLLVREAEELYGNDVHFRRQKLKSSFRINQDLSLRHFERKF